MQNYPRADSEEAVASALRRGLVDLHEGRLLKKQSHTGVYSCRFDVCISYHLPLLIERALAPSLMMFTFCLIIFLWNSGTRGPSVGKLAEKPKQEGGFQEQLIQGTVDPACEPKD